MQSTLFLSVTANLTRLATELDASIETIPSKSVEQTILTLLPSLQHILGLFKPLSTPSAPNLSQDPSVVEIGKTLDLDLSQSRDLLKSFLRSETSLDYDAPLPATHPIAELWTGLIQYYFSERRAVLAIVAALLRIHHERVHRFRALADKVASSWTEADGGDALAQTILRQLTDKWTDRLPSQFADSAGFVEIWERQRMDEYLGLLEILFLIGTYSGKAPPPNEAVNASTMSLDTSSLPPPALTPSLRVRIIQNLAESRFGLRLTDSAAFGADNQGALEDIVELANLVFLTMLTMDVVIQDIRLDDHRTILSSPSDLSSVHEIIVEILRNSTSSDRFLRTCSVSLLGWALLLVRFRALITRSSSLSSDSLDEFSSAAVRLGIIRNEAGILMSPTGSSADETDPTVVILNILKGLNVDKHIVARLRTRFPYNQNNRDRVPHLTTLKDMVMVLSHEFRLVPSWIDVLAEIYTCGGSTPAMTTDFWVNLAGEHESVLNNVMDLFPTESAVVNKLMLGLSKGSPAALGYFEHFQRVGTLCEIVRDVSGLQQRSFYANGIQFQEVETILNRRLIPGSERFAVFVPSGTVGTLTNHESGYKVVTWKFKYSVFHLFLAILEAYCNFPNDPSRWDISLVPRPRLISEILALIHRIASQSYLEPPPPFADVDYQMEPDILGHLTADVPYRPAVGSIRSKDIIDLLFSVLNVSSSITDGPRLDFGTESIHHGDILLESLRCLGGRWIEVLPRDFWLNVTQSPFFPRYGGQMVSESGVSVPQIESILKRILEGVDNIPVKIALTGRYLDLLETMVHSAVENTKGDERDAVLRSTVLSPNLAYASTLLVGFSRLREGSAVHRLAIMSRILNIVGVVLDDTTLWSVGQKSDDRDNRSTNFILYHISLQSLHSDMLDRFIGTRASPSTVNAIISIIRAGSESWGVVDANSIVGADTPELEALLLSTLRVTLSLVEWRELVIPGAISLLERSLVDIDSKAITALARLVVVESIDEQIRGLAIRILTALLRTMAALPISSISGAVSFVACLGDYAEDFAVKAVRILEDEDEDQRLQFELWRFLIGCLQDQVGLASMFLKVAKIGEENQSSLVTLLKSTTRNWKDLLKKSPAILASCLTVTASLWSDYPIITAVLREDASFWDALLSPISDVEAIFANLDGDSKHTTNMAYFLVICSRIFSIIASEVFIAERMSYLKRDLTIKANLRRVPVLHLLQSVVGNDRIVRSWFKHIIKFPYNPDILLDLKEKAPCPLDLFLRPDYQKGGNLEWDISSYAYDTGLMRHKLPSAAPALFVRFRQVNENLALTDAAQMAVKWWGKLVEVLAFASEFKNKEWKAVDLGNQIKFAMNSPESTPDTRKSNSVVRLRMRTGYNTALAETLFAVTLKGDAAQILPLLCEVVLEFAFSTEEATQSLRLYLLGALLQSMQQTNDLDSDRRNAILAPTGDLVPLIIKQLARSFPELHYKDSKHAVAETVLLLTIFTEICCSLETSLDFDQWFKVIVRDGLLESLTEVLLSERIMRQTSRPSLTAVTLQTLRALLRHHRVNQYMLGTGLVSTLIDNPMTPLIIGGKAAPYGLDGEPNELHDIWCMTLEIVGAMLAGEGRHPATYDFGMSVVLIYRDPLFRTLHSALGETISVLQAKELKIITSMFCFLSWHVKSRQVDLAPAAKEILASYVTLSLMILRRFCELIGHPNTFASSVQPLSREEKRWSTEELTSTIEDSLLICLRNIATTFRCLAGCSDIRTILSLAPDAGHFSLFGFGECVAAIAFRTKELAEAVKGPRQAGELAHRLPDHRNGISFLENSLAFEAGQVARIKATSRGDREELRLLQEIVGQTWQMVDGSLEGYENVPAGGKNVLELSKALHTNQ